MSLPIAHLLTETVKWKAPSSVSTGGDLGYGSLQSGPARVERTDEIVLTEEGNEERAEYVIAMAVEIPKRSRVWTPDDDDTDVSAARRRLIVTWAKTPSGDRLYITKLSASGEG